MPFEKKEKYIDGSELVRFDLNKPVKANFDDYQDAVEKFPHSTQQLKMRFDQYLKCVNLHKSDIQGEEESVISFETVGKE